MGNKQESMWYILLVGAPTALRSPLTVNSTRGAEGTMVDWATVSLELLIAEVT